MWVGVGLIWRRVNEVHWVGPPRGPMMTLLLAPRAQNGDTALILASSNGHLEIVQTLLAAGAYTEATDDVGDGKGGVGW